MVLFGVGVTLAAYAGLLGVRFGTAPSSYFLSEFVQVAAYLICGLVASRLRPYNRIGRRMLLAGAVLAGVAPIGFRVVSENPLIVATQTAAVLLIGLQLPVMAHVLLSYPTGEVDDDKVRALLRWMYAYGAVAGVALLVTWPRPSTTRGAGSAFIVGYLVDDAWTATVVTRIVWLGFVPFVMCGTALFLFRLRLARRTGNPQRWLLSVSAIPLVTTAWFATAWLVQSGLGSGQASAASVTTLQAMTYASVFALPFGVLVGLVHDQLPGASPHREDDNACLSG